MIQFLLFLYGLIFGSFFNVVGLRVPVKQSIVAPRSACPFCGRQLKVYELIPVISFLLQGGKCRGCKARISPLYPIVELLTGVLFAVAPVFVGWSQELIVAWTLISLLMIIFVSDLRYMLIPDKILLIFSGIFLLERIVIPLTPWRDSLFGAATGFLLLLAIALISKGGMGGGDIKLFAVIGFVLGVKLVVLSFFLSALYGAIFGIAALLLKIVKRRQPIPFGPFIVAGTISAYFWGSTLIALYFHFLEHGFS
ncbi:prepilin peptidase [Neobacillus sp. SM06]|uniref:prepilin peptidase n=1 Tax=Neobacillus sp. SM06 TaxID=3422492 RepID=UPI003D26A3A9